MLSNFAFVSDGDADELTIGQMGQKFANHSSHRDVWGQDRVHFRGHERSVDRIPGRFPS